MSKPTRQPEQPGEMLLSDASALVAALARVRAVAETFAELGERLSGEDVLKALAGNHPVPLYSATRTVCVLTRGRSATLEDLVSLARFGEWLAGKATAAERARANAAEQRAERVEDELRVTHGELTKLVGEEYTTASAAAFEVEGRMHAAEQRVRELEAERDHAHRAGRNAAAQAIRDHADKWAPHRPDELPSALRRHLLMASRVARPEPTGAELDAAIAKAAAATDITWDGSDRA